MSETNLYTTEEAAAYLKYNLKQFYYWVYAAKHNRIEPLERNRKPVYFSKAVLDEHKATRANQRRVESRRKQAKEARKRRPGYNPLGGRPRTRDQAELWRLVPGTTIGGWVQLDKLRAYRFNQRVNGVGDVFYHCDLRKGDKITYHVKLTQNQDESLQMAIDMAKAL